MKKIIPPTLADSCVVTAQHKRFAKSPHTSYMNLFKQVAYARKFVLDDDMSRFMVDLLNDLYRRGARKRKAMLDNVRRLARLPHALTWIEFNYPKYMERAAETSAPLRVVFNKGGKNPERYGWLIKQHPKIETAFFACEARSCVTDDASGLAFFHPIGYCWSVDDSAPPWPRLDDERYSGVDNYETPCAFFTYDLPRHTTESMLESLLYGCKTEEDMRVAGTPALSARMLFTLLATLNDLPVRMEGVKPAGGYFAAGGYKRFLAHSIVHLTVPETQWRSLTRKTAASVRRRAHQVRGHWRKDWRKPLREGCEHEFDVDMICTRCLGHKIWVNEYQRGDAGIGFTTHDYNVHHDRQE